MNFPDRKNRKLFDWPEFVALILGCVLLATVTFFVLK